MAKKKKKDIPFHIAHNYKHFELSDGTKFWADNDNDARLYRNKLGTSIFKDGTYFKEIEIK